MNAPLRLTPHRRLVMEAVERGEYSAQETHTDGYAWLWGKLGRPYRGDPFPWPRLDPLTSSEGRTLRALARAGLVRLSRAGSLLGCRTVLTTAAGRHWMGGPVAKTHRGTSNGKSRGGSADRARRRQYLVNAYGDGETVQCVLQLAGCIGTLTVDTVSVDRIVPGCQGGTYRRDNIQPSCQPCQSRQGARITNERKGTRS